MWAVVTCYIRWHDGVTAHCHVERGAAGDACNRTEGSVRGYTHVQHAHLQDDDQRRHLSSGRLWLRGGREVEQSQRRCQRRWERKKTGHYKKKMWKSCAKPRLLRLTAMRLVLWISDTDDGAGSKSLRCICSELSLGLITPSCLFQTELRKSPETF